jgi:cytochrome c-type biogenesis protein
MFRRETFMSLTALGLLAAFAGGVLSFLSPCVFPLVPGYLSYLAGTSLEEAQSQPTTRWRVSRHALWFVLGFALLFTLLGVAAALLGSALRPYQQVLARIAGLLLVLFGIALTGLLPIPWVSRDHRVQVQPGRPAWWRSGLIGMAFGAGWSACTGPILGSILVLTAVRSTLLQGVIFLLAYALGLGVPFLLVGILVDRAGTLMRRIRRYTGPLSFIGGAILILMGMLILTGRLDQLANLLFPFSFSP